MVKKKEPVEIIFPQELKKYLTSDGMEFKSLKAAQEHEEDLKNPYYKMYKDKCKELEEEKRESNEKDLEIELLNKRIEDLQKSLLRGPQDYNRFPNQPAQDPYARPCPADPSQQPYRWNCECKPKYS